MCASTDLAIPLHICSMNINYKSMLNAHMRILTAIII